MVILSASQLIFFHRQPHIIGCVLMATNLLGAKGLTLHTTYLQLLSLTLEIIDNGNYTLPTFLIIILKFIYFKYSV